MKQYILAITYLFQIVFGHLVPYPIVWLPYDDRASVENPFFTKHPRKIFEDGDFNIVPTMIGLTKDDGIMQSITMYKNPDKFREFW